MKKNRNDHQAQVKLQKLLSKTQKDGDCMLWTGAVLRRPKYSQSSWKYPHIDYRGKRWRGNRLIYFLCHGQIPSGKLVLHRCGKSLCINPNHLYLGDAKQNAIDTLNHGHNKASKRTHCPYGHRYSGDNLKLRANGHRSCRSCEWHKSNRRGKNISKLPDISVLIYSTKEMRK